jgi:cytidyltransferase-like protein
MPKKVLCFGVFDCLHDGHRHFLRYANLFGDTIIVAVARDTIVQKLKRKTPKQSEIERMRAITNEDLAHIAVLGDEIMGHWTAMHEYQPTIVAVGYDQTALAEALEAAREDFPFHFDIIRVSAHEPEKYHSSLLN